MFTPSEKAKPDFWEFIIHVKLDISLHSLELDDPAAKSGLSEEFSKRLKDKVINQE